MKLAMIWSKSKFDDNPVIAYKCRQTVVSDCLWHKADNQAGAVPGEAGGFFVANRSWNRRAYLKPLKRDTIFRAAREKIASDLAYDLNLPVPPVVLYRRPEASENEEKHVALSLVMYPRHIPWGSIKMQIDRFFSKLIACRDEWSRMLVFDTWVDQVDHGDHPNNIVLGYDPANHEDCHLVFLDFSFSMGYNGRWRTRAPGRVSCASFPTWLRSQVDPDAIEEGIQEIKRISEETISSVVNRIPEDFLPDDEKLMIVEGLISRRNCLNPDLFR